MWYAAVVRAVTGRASRSLLRSVLRGWRSHCDKVHMLNNMRGLLGKTAADDRSGSPTSPPHAEITLMPPPPMPPPLPPTLPVPVRPRSALVCSLRWRLAASEVLRRRRPKVVLAQDRLPRPAAIVSSPRPAHELPATPPRSQALDDTTTHSPRPRPSDGIESNGRHPDPDPYRHPHRDPEDGLDSNGRHAPPSAILASSPPLARDSQQQAALLPHRLLAWLSPADEASGGGGWRLSASAEAHAVRLQHLTTENNFLRERVSMVEASVQPLLEEVRARLLIARE